MLNVFRYEETRDKLQQVNDHRDLEILRNAAVVGLTTSGLADKQSLIAALAPKVTLAISFLHYPRNDEGRSVFPT